MLGVVDAEVLDDVAPADSETVRILPTLRATFCCIRRKPYQRRRVSFLRNVGAVAMSMRRS